MPAEQQNDFKKLGFVSEYGTKGYEIATNVYTSAKSYVPAPIQEKLTKVEETVAVASAPYLTKAQDKGTEILKAVDDQVDKAFQSASSVYQSNTAYIQSQLEKQKQFHQHNLEAYKAAREQYLKKAEESVAFIRSKGVSGAAKVATDELSAAIVEARKIPGTLISKVHEAFTNLVSMEPVKKALDSAMPAVNAAYARYESLHSAVITSPSYKKAFDFSQATLARAQESFIYKKAKENLYPYVAKYADPAVEQIAASPYYKAAVEHVTPKHATVA